MSCKVAEVATRCVEVPPSPPNPREPPRVPPDGGSRDLALPQGGLSEAGVSPATAARWIRLAAGRSGIHSQVERHRRNEHVAAGRSDVILIELISEVAVNVLYSGGSHYFDPTWRAASSEGLAKGLPRVADNGLQPLRHVGDLGGSARRCARMTHSGHHSTRAGQST